MSAILEVEHLSVTRGKNPVLHDLTFTVNGGDFVSLIGCNGSGKSTLLAALLGFVKSEGKIAWSGEPLDRWRSRDLAKTVGYLPQLPSHEPGDRVIDVIRLGRLPHQGFLAMESAADASAVERILDLLALKPIATRPMETLSGGQRQFVYLARALVQEPKVLLLDEATTFLDLRHQVELHQLLDRAVTETGVTILMASHDLNLAALYAKSAIILKAGRILKSGNIHTALDPATLSDAFDVKIARTYAGSRPIFAVE